MPLPWSAPTATLTGLTEPYKHTQDTIGQALGHIIHRAWWGRHGQLQTHAFPSKPRGLRLSQRATVGWEGWGRRSSSPLAWTVQSNLVYARGEARSPILPLLSPSHTSVEQAKDNVCFYRERKDGYHEHRWVFSGSIFILRDVCDTARWKHQMSDDI